jgi:type I restriction enzyme S subunit
VVSGRAVEEPVVSLNALPDGEQSLRRFKRYPAYADCHAQWLGKVPIHWRCAALKRVVDPFRPITYGIVQCGPDSADGVPYVRPVDMDDERGVRVDSLQRTAPAIAAAYARSTVRPDDIIVSIGPSFGKVMIVPPELRGANLTQGTARIASGPDIWPRFLFWWLRSALVQQTWDSYCSGATFRALTLEVLGSCEVLLPPLEEQHAIAAFLDRETAKIDALVAKKERLIELLQERRHALIAATVIGGLEASAPRKHSGVDELGEVPAHWQIQKATWLFVIGSGTTPRSDNPAYYGGDIPWITTSELRESIVTSTEKSISEAAATDHPALRVYPEGSIAVAMYGATIGRLGMFGVPATVNQACCVFSYPKGINMLFWWYWLQMRRPYLISLGYGGGQPNLSQELLRSIRLPVPPLEEQNRIVDFLRRETAVIDQLRAKIREGIRHLRELRTAIIGAAVMGRIDVREKVT